MYIIIYIIAIFAVEYYNVIFTTQSFEEVPEKLNIISNGDTFLALLMSIRLLYRYVLYKIRFKLP